VQLPSAGGAPLVRLLPSGRSLAVGFALVLGAVGLYLLARVTPMFSLSQIEVEGAPPAVAEHVRRALAPLEESSLLALEPSDVERRLSALPDVAGASYDRDFPHTLRVTVRAEHPVAVARHGTRAWIVAASTRVIQEVPLGTRQALPRVWLEHSDDPQPGTRLADRLALRAVRALALARLADFHGWIRRVRARERDLTFLLASGIELRLGDLRAVPLKLAIAARVLPGLLRDRRYLYLDVSVPERPVVGSTLNPQPER